MYSNSLSLNVLVKEVHVGSPEYVVKYITLISNVITKKKPFGDKENTKLLSKRLRKLS